MDSRQFKPRSKLKWSEPLHLRRVLATDAFDTTTWNHRIVIVLLYAVPLTVLSVGVLAYKQSQGNSYSTLVTGIAIVWPLLCGLSVGVGLPFFYNRTLRQITITGTSISIDSGTRLDPQKLVWAYRVESTVDASDVKLIEFSTVEIEEDDFRTLILHRTSGELIEIGVDWKHGQDLDRLAFDLEAMGNQVGRMTDLPS